MSTSSAHSFGFRTSFLGPTVWHGLALSVPIFMGFVIGRGSGRFLYRLDDTLLAASLLAETLPFGSARFDQAHPLGLRLLDSVALASFGIEGATIVRVLLLSLLAFLLSDTLRERGWLHEVGVLCFMAVLVARDSLLPWLFGIKHYGMESFIAFCVCVAVEPRDQKKTVDLMLLLGSLMGVFSLPLFVILARRAKSTVFRCVLVGCCLNVASMAPNLLAQVTNYSDAYAGRLGDGVVEALNDPFGWFALGVLGVAVARALTLSRFDIFEFMKHPMARLKRSVITSLPLLAGATLFWILATELRHVLFLRTMILAVALRFLWQMANWTKLRQIFLLALALLACIGPVHIARDWLFGSNLGPASAKPQPLDLEDFTRMQGTYKVSSTIRGSASAEILCHALGSSCAWSETLPDYFNLRWTTPGESFAELVGRSSDEEVTYLREIRSRHSKLVLVAVPERDLGTISRLDNCKSEQFLHAELLPVLILECVN